MTKIFVATVIVIALVLAGASIYLLVLRKRVKVKEESIEVLAEYVRLKKQHDEQQQHLKDLKTAEQKQKLEIFKQTREQLRDKLKSQIDEKQWKPLENILKSADKGGVGIYVLYNESKNKYYVGQAKQLFKRIREHFAVEDIARDYLAGDRIHVKVLTANEIDADYRLDHIEKTGIDIFNSDKDGYNRRTGNL